MDKKTFGKNFTNDSAALYFTFSGTPLKRKIDDTKIENLMDQYFKNLKSYNDGVKDITAIRTILKDFDENYLELRVLDNKDHIIIKYVNKELIIYKKTSSLNEETASIKYEKKKEMAFSFSNPTVECSPSNEIVEFVQMQVKELHSLQNISPIILDRDAKKLCEIYQLFYQKNPNFSSKTENIKVQTMMSILTSVGVSLGEDYAFSLYPHIEMPISYKLEEIVHKLSPLGEISDIDKPVPLNKKVKEIIKMVGQSLKEQIEEEKEIEMLILLSNVIYALEYDLAKPINLNEIAKSSGYSISEVESCKELVKRIDQKMK